MHRIPLLAWRYLRGDAAVRRHVAYLATPYLYRALFATVKRPPARARKVFVDLGANVGGGFDTFSRMFSPRAYDYVFFEPNPACMAALKKHVAGARFGRKPTFVQAASWVKDGTLSFYGPAESGDPRTEGGSVMPDHNTAMYRVQARKALKVKAVDMAKWFADLQERYDVIMVKMDIEGAELEVLEHLWRKKGLFRKPVTMFVEFHAYAHAKAADRRRAAAREAAIKAAAPDGVGVWTWF